MKVKDTLPILKTILKGAGIVLIGTLISKSLGLLYRIFVARSFGPENYGAFSLVLAMAGILISMALVGLPTGITRYSAYYFQKDQDKLRAVVIASIKITLPISVLLGVVLFVVSNNITSVFFKGSPEVITILLKFASFVLPVAILAEVCNAFLVGIQKIEQVMTERIVHGILQLVLTMSFAFLGYGVASLGAAWLLAITASSLISFYFLKKTDVLKRKGVKRYDFRKKIFLFSYPLMFVAIMSNIIASTDTLMIGYFLDAAHVGIYNAALPLASLVLMPSALLTTLLLPTITALYAKKQNAMIISIYNTVVRWGFITTLPLTCILTFFGSQVLTIVFGTRFITATPSLAILSIGFLLSFVILPAQNILSMAKKTKITFLMSTLIAVSNILLNFILIPPFGLVGAAIASLTSYIMGYIGYRHLVNNYVRTKILSSVYVKSIFAGIVAIIPIYGLNMFVTLNTATAIIATAIYLLLYIAALVLTRSFSKEDRQILISVLQRVGISPASKR